MESLFAGGPDWQVFTELVTARELNSIEEIAWLFQDFALTAGLFGCQVWATSSLTVNSSKVTPPRASWKDTWVSRKVQWLQWGVTFSQVVWLIGCWSAEYWYSLCAPWKRCPFFSHGSDASYESETVYSLHTSSPWESCKLCGLTFSLQIEVMDFFGSVSTPQFPFVSTICECHTISQVYPSKAERANSPRRINRSWRKLDTWTPHDNHHSRRNMRTCHKQWVYL